MKISELIVGLNINKADGKVLALKKVKILRGYSTHKHLIINSIAQRFGVKKLPKQFNYIVRFSLNYFFQLKNKTMKDCNIFDIWEDYKSSLLGYIQKRVADKQDAEDILQDILLKSYQFCAKGKAVLHLKAWLFKITQNTIIDYYKKNKRPIPIEIDRTNDTHEHSLVGEASDYIKELLKLLPEEYALPLYMSDLENIDQKTIAEKLNLSLPNTKSRIQRGRLKLKERFLECCIVAFDENGEMIGFDIKPQCQELQAEKKRLNALISALN
jgi:RNA polymerase sigma-70 factor, ECF subfamily